MEWLNFASCFICERKSGRRFDQKRFRKIRIINIYRKNNVINNVVYKFCIDKTEV